mgnify:CR=1 FL=1
MTQKGTSQWDFVRFFTTLGYFGEVPFLGSFRWLQKWLGQSPTVAGKALNSMNRKVFITKQFSRTMLESLRERVAPEIEVFALKDVKDNAEDNAALQGGTAAIQSYRCEVASLCETAVVADTVVVGNSNRFTSLVADLSTYLGEDSDIVRRSAFDFTQSSSDVSAWGALDDVVMGGVSEGAFFLKGERQFEMSEQRSAVFAGRVSTQNSGGFSSVRTRNFEPPFNFSGWSGLWLRVKGDGQRYKFIVRNSEAWDSPAYVYIFDTVADEWITVRVPFAELVPTFRAKSVPNASPFNPAQTVSFQLMLSKFEYDGRLNPRFSAGPFELAVAKIEAYRKRQGAALIVVGSSEPAERGLQQSALIESGLRYQLIEPEGQDLADQDLAEAIATALS